MHLDIEKSALSNLIQTASRPIPSRSTMPSIKGCLIEASSEGVTFLGTNLDWGVKIFAPAKVSSQGSLVVSSKLLEDAVRTLKDTVVTLSLAQSAWALNIKTQTSHMVLNAVPADDFPRWPEEPKGEEMSLKGGLLKEMVRIGATCAVTNPARPLWGACLLEFSDEGMAFVSTDQFALSKALTLSSWPTVSAIIPANVLTEISRLVDDGDDVKIKVSDNYIYFTTPKVSCFSRLIEGQYYAYRQVIPKDFFCEVTVSTEALYGAASRAAIVSSEEDKAMRVIFKKEEATLCVKAGSSEKGNMEESIPATFKGEGLEVWVQHRYVLQALSKIGSAEVKLGVSGELSPIKLSPVTGDGENPVEATFVIMPMSSPKGDL